MLSTYESSTELGTKLKVQEFSDTIEISIADDQKMNIATGDFAELIRILKRVERDMAEDPEEFELPDED